MVDDSDNNDTATDENLLSIARNVIVDGAAIFFPDRETRRKQLFQMINSTDGEVWVSIYVDQIWHVFSFC